MLLLIDNYDSFTYNLYQYIGEFEKDILVIRNDKITTEEIMKMSFDKIVISPGPKSPKDAGNCVDIIKNFADKMPILGICLGHQCIGEAFGGEIIHGKSLFHGKSSNIILKEDKLFKGMTLEQEVGRYHSLVVNYETIPECFNILALSEEKEIMAMKHNVFDVYGLQFHPESILTKDGKKIIENYMNI